MAIGKGIPLDSVALMSTVLEGILYGQYTNVILHPILTKIAFFRLFRPHVYWHYLGADPQTSHAGRQSSNHSCSRLAVCTEHCGQLFAWYIWCHMLKSSKHMVVSIIRTEEGLVQYHDRPKTLFAELSRGTFMTNGAIFVFQTLLGDGVVVGSIIYFPFRNWYRKAFWMKIYRCYIVWQTVWVIILPSMLWCGVAG